MPDNMQTEIKQVTPEKVAERWLRIKGIKEPEQKGFSLPQIKKEEPSAGLLQEAYDLFAEREDLREDVVRRKPENSNGTQVLTADKKAELIKSGNVKDLLSTMSKEPFGEVVARSESRIQEVEERLQDTFKKPGMYEKFQKNLSEQVAVRRAAREVRSLDQLNGKLDMMAIKVARDTQVLHRSPTSVERNIVEESGMLKQTIEKRRKELVSKPEVRAQVRLAELKEYKRQLQHDGFVETPSRKRYVDGLVKLWAENKKVLVTGATGTGKTELVRHASQRMFGIRPFTITGHRDMTPYELLGRTGMKIEGGKGSDVYRHSQVGQAMLAREGKGAPILYDEFDASPNEANIALKTILNDGPGDIVRFQMDSDQAVKIGPDYSFTATANVKSDKHATRFEVDPAIVRVLEPMIVPYMPPAEVWDIAAASLMDRRGGLPLSVKEAEGTLKDLCDAAFWIQKAYLGEKVITDPAVGSFIEARGGATTGKPATLKEAVLDPGRLISMLRGYETAELKGENLRTYLNEQLVRFINNENFPEDDRYYLTEILALKGFLQGTKIEDLKVNGLDQATLDKWTGYKPAESSIPSADAEELLGKDSKRVRNYLTADQVARLDPYGRFRGMVSKDAEDLLNEEGQPKAETRNTPVVTVDKIRAIQAALGNIADKSAGEVAHKAYVDKLDQIATNAQSNKEKIEAAEALEDYNKRGAFKDQRPGSSVRSLTELAQIKAAQVRSNAITASTNLSELGQFTGDVTKEGHKNVHQTYITKVFELGNEYNATPDITRQAIAMLEKYVTSGFYKGNGIIRNNSINDKPLTERASEYLSRLRAKLISSV